MSRNGGFVTLKQFRHLVGGEPHGVIGEGDFYFSLSVLGLVEEDVAFGVVHGYKL